MARRTSRRGQKTLYLLYYEIWDWLHLLQTCPCLSFRLECNVYSGFQASNLYLQILSDHFPQSAYVSDLSVQLLHDDGPFFHTPSSQKLSNLSSNPERIIQYGSRTLSLCEANYSTIEVMMLAVQWALIGIFKKSIPELTNPWLSRMHEKLMKYSFKITWIEGRKNVLADILSRNLCENTPKTNFPIHTYLVFPSTWTQKIKTAAKRHGLPRLKTIQDLLTMRMYHQVHKFDSSLWLKNWFLFFFHTAKFKLLQCSWWVV